MTAAKSKVEKPAEKTPEPVVSVLVGFDGLRAVDTTTWSDGVVHVDDPRDATFAEQVSALAPQVLEQAVGIVHNAASGSVSTDGAVITITLVAH